MGCRGLKWKIRKRSPKPKLKIQMVDCLGFRCWGLGVQNLWAIAKAVSMRASLLTQCSHVVDRDRAFKLALLLCLNHLHLGVKCQD